MPKPDLWMPFFIGDYFADTSHLSHGQHGAYIMALLHEWHVGPLPNDLEVVARIMRMACPDALSIARALLEEFFFQGEDGLWRQKRLEILKAKALRNSVINREKAIKAAKARWKDHQLKAAPDEISGDAPSIAPSNARSNAQGHPQAMPIRGSTKSKYTPSLRSGVPKKLVNGSGGAERTKSEASSKSTKTQKTHTRLASASEGASGIGSLPTGSNGAGRHQQKSGNISPIYASGAQNGNGNGSSHLANKKQKSDPRAESFKQEIFAYWKDQNPDGPQCPWGVREIAALGAMLQASPDIDLPAFRKLLRNRSRSEVNPSDLPRRWLGQLQAYAHGPLNKYGDSLS